MMDSVYYRGQALAARTAAAREPLVQRRRQHETSAERWEEMQRKAEELERRTALNAKDRLERPYHQTLRAASR